MANPKRSTQYIAAVAATLGGMALGTVIGWSAPAEVIIKTSNSNIDDYGISWISSIMPIGAAVAQIYMGLTLDQLGRKLTILTLSLPFIVGWLILSFANNVPLFCVGRFVTGFCGGAFCVAAPTYIGEMADKGVRGTLSVFFQLLLVIGILLTYALGEFKNMFAITIPLITLPILFFVIFLFLPESPVFLLLKGKQEKAQKALKFFRGEDYDISGEMKDMEDYIKKDTEGFWKKFKTRACIKASLMVLVMHVVQQLSGINAIMFFAHKIFEMAGSTMSSGVNAIILALVQVLLTGVSAYLVDRSGRKFLWIISLSIMTACLVLMGVYFMIKRNDEKTAESMAWLPLIVICLYLAGFSLATGPLPWAMIGEFLPNTVKIYLAPLISAFNWLLAFAVTKTFAFFVEKIGADIVFWFFAAVCGAGIAFVILFLIETKNKTLEEIQTELGTPPA